MFLWHNYEKKKKYFFTWILIIFKDNNLEWLLFFREIFFPTNISDKSMELILVITNITGPINKTTTKTDYTKFCFNWTIFACILNLNHR